MKVSAGFKTKPEQETGFLVHVSCGTLGGDIRSPSGLNAGEGTGKHHPCPSFPLLFIILAGRCVVLACPLAGPPRQSYLLWAVGSAARLPGVFSGSLTMSAFGGRAGGRVSREVSEVGVSALP